MPVLLYLVLGTWALWKTHLLIWLWWILPACWGVTYLVARFWPAPRLQDEPLPSAAHFTKRDSSAAEIVLKYQQQVDALTPKELTDLHFYLRQFESLSKELATHYHPEAEDPISSLTIPELAAAARLVADDLEQLVLHSIPGSRLLTVGRWRSFGETPKWVNRIRNSVWAGSFLLNPLNIVRYGVSRVTVDKVGTGLQAEVLARIYLRAIRQVGFYLIEMNSGRLRGGADAYRATFENQRRFSAQTHGSSGEQAAVDIDARPVTIGLIGQASAGKSSLVNYLTGSNQAVVDLLPETSQIARYSFTAASSGRSGDPMTVELLDSPGYGVDGTNRSQMDEIQTAIGSSDILLLVTDGHSPAKSADVETLRQVAAYCEINPNLRQPPVIVVLTHVDQIPPAMVWSPPYSLSQPQTPKGENIAQAVAYAREVFSELPDLVVDVTAVCSGEDLNRRWGLQENLLPAIVSQLETGQSVSLLQAFEKSLNSGWAKTLAGQLKTGSTQLLKLWLEEKRKRNNARE